MSYFGKPEITDSGKLYFHGVHVAGKPNDKRYDVWCKDGKVSEISAIDTSQAERDCYGFLTPSLCHPHIHLDKAFLLSHPKYADLEIEKGDFAEAMKLTSEAKKRFSHDDLIERGRKLIQESINFGVTHMRAFVEVDFGVGSKCLEASLALKKEFSGQCYIQICVFAQDPIFSYDDGGQAMMDLLIEACRKPGVEVFGSTPYVESNGEVAKQVANMEFAIEMAHKYKLHVDFHIDYNLDPDQPSMVLKTLDLLHKINWITDREDPNFRTIVFGHCTRLTLFGNTEWSNLRDKVGSLPVSFVALPTSDLFMMGRPKGDDKDGQRPRGTLQALQIIKQYDLNVVLGVNNVGNAFTPQGSCDPLSLASLGVGLYQAGTKQDAELLLQCVSTRAKSAIGITLSTDYEAETSTNSQADFVVFHNNANAYFRARKTVQDLVYDPIPIRTTVYRGLVVNQP